MKLSLAELWEIKMVLDLRLNGVNIVTGKRVPINLPLPASMKRHLRRVLESINDEINIANPEREDFIKKWKVYGKNKDEMPKEKEKSSEYKKDYNELFEPRDFVIPFSPFHLDLLDNLDEIIPDDIEGTMMNMNEAFKEQQKEVASEKDSSAGEKIDAPESATPDA